MPSLKTKIEGDEMSRIIAIAILSALTLFSDSASWMSSPSMPQDREMEVMVLFSGLMVFHEREEGLFEVGILRQELAEGHEFCVQRLGAQRICRQTPQSKKSSPHKDPREELNWLPTGTKWTLSVINLSTGMPVASTGMAVGAAQRKQRRPDVEGGQFDLGWIIDLDGDGFHEEELDLIPGQLMPIIQLPKGELFTKYKSPDFVRWQGKRPKNPKAFGFVAESIGLRIKLKKGEELILQEEDDPAKPTLITNVPYVPPSPVGGDYEVVMISNIRYPQHYTSDFFMYYKLFRGVDKSKQFDFDENTTEPCEPPHNPKPCLPLNPAPKRKSKDEMRKAEKAKDRKAEKLTCCGLVCTQIRLVNRKDPLK